MKVWRELFQPLRWWLAVALILTLSGLARVDYFDCSVIHEGWPAERSDYVQERGFVLSWLLTGRTRLLSFATSVGWKRTGLLSLEFKNVFPNFGTLGDAIDSSDSNSHLGGNRVR